MGKKSRPRPGRLAEKLLKIRLAYDLSQNGIINRLGLSNELVQADISAFELGSREPALPHLLRYARIAGVIVDILIDDEMELPKKLATDPSHGVVKSLTQSRKKKG
jgi:transcriptional regulator with XRE-family HTH domain